MAEGDNNSGRKVSDEELRELLSAYLDGQLESELRAQLEVRLKQSSELREELEELRAIMTALAELPPVSAPAGFAAEVMARVEGLEIPSLAPNREPAPVGPDQELENLSVPFWLKASIGLSAAATLALGYLVFRAPLESNFGDLSKYSSDAELTDNLSAPLGTGLSELPSASGVEGDDLQDQGSGQDGVVAMEPEQLKQDSAPPVVSAPRTERTSSRGPSKGGDRSAAKSVSPASRAGKSKRRAAAGGLKEVVAERGDGLTVHQAEHEAAGLAENSSESAADQQLSAIAAEPDSDGVVELDAAVELEAGGAPVMEMSARSAGVRSAAQPAPSSVESDLSFLSGRSVARRASGTVRARRSADVPDATDLLAADEPVRPLDEQSSELVVVSEEQSVDGVDAPSIAAKVAIGTLVVAAPGAISTLIAELEARSWAVQNLTPMPSTPGSWPSSGAQVLQITVAEGQEESLATLLGSYGALNTDRILSAAHDGLARLRLTVRWGD
ncbi:MAG: hypothetical protein CMP23_16600 [Rickettsiales bacterium]|nr:hypothetical protein [Rickettsiales bacterium]